ILFSPSGVARTSKVDHLFNPSLLSASSSPSSPVTRETGKDKHSQLCRVGGEESQNTKCTASISRQKNFLFLFLVQLGAFWNISARGHALRSQASSLLEAGHARKGLGLR
ncbi:hypothetical protein H0G86_011358, partial [Trichoderma simmonsii]